MHLYLKTYVSQPADQVWTGFDRTLFDQLAPPFPPVDVVRFDGCKTGDIVHLRLNFLFFKQDWISLISDQQATETEIYFVDTGTKLPFFLSQWQHRHRLLRLNARPNAASQTCIVEDITFHTPTRLTDYLLYPLLWLQFAYRRPIYRRFFGAPRKTKNLLK